VELADALRGLARHGLTHGDLSAYNVLVHDGRLLLIDLPQVVDVIGNPQGPAFLTRDLARVTEWFAARAARRGGRGGRAARRAVRRTAHSPRSRLGHNLTALRTSHHQGAVPARPTAGPRVCLITSARPFRPRKSVVAGAPCTTHQGVMHARARPE
jgi:serine/threonine-protein kinase RIO1